MKIKDKIKQVRLENQTFADKINSVINIQRELWYTINYKTQNVTWLLVVDEINKIEIDTNK